MIKNVLESIAGVEVFPVISLLLFVIVFTVMFVWAMRRDKEYLTEMAELPLRENETDERRS
jgi:cytochrome c oxidase cbb3-type subunit 4